MITLRMSHAACLGGLAKNKRASSRVAGHGDLPHMAC